LLGCDFVKLQANLPCYPQVKLGFLLAVLTASVDVLVIPFSSTTILLWKVTDFKFLNAFSNAGGALSLM